MTSTNPERAAGEPVRLLVVTDRTDVPEYVDSAIDATTTVERDTFSAVERIGQSAFDCVVCDYEMEPLTGLELLAAIRQRDATLPVVLLVEDADEAVERAVVDDITDYVSPDGDPSTVADAIRALLADGNGDADVPAGAEQQSAALERVTEATRQCMTATSPDLLTRSQRLADVGAWAYDPDTDRLRVTDQTRQICGTEPGELLDVESWLTVYHPDDRDRMATAFDRARQFGIGFDYRVRLDRPEEPTRWVRVVAEAVTTDGDVTAVRGALRDITVEHRRQRRLERNEQALRDLHKVTTDADRSFDDRIDALLEVGRERVGLSVGYLTTVEDETVELSRIVGDAEGFHEGQRLPLEETFCRKVTERESVVSIYDTVAQGLGDDPAYRRFGLSSYVGAPFFVEGELHGTLCFVDTEPRERPFSDLQLAFVRVLVQAVAALFARRHRREQLQTLHEATRALFEAESTEEIPTLTIQSLESISDAPPIVFYRWDENVGGLVRAAASADGIDRDDGPIRPGDGPVWDGFVRGDQTLEPLRAESGDDVATATEIIVPVDDFGVIVLDRRAGSEESSFDTAFLRTLARNVTAAFETVEQNEQLQAYTAELERRNDRLERLERINAIVRDTQRTLVEADSRGEIESAVCENLTAIEHWDLAWIGGPDIADQSFAVRGRSDERATALASATGGGAPSIARTAFDEQHIVEIPNILSADGPEPWRQTALEQGHQSAIAIPISFGTHEYGILELYADRPGAFAENERSVLAELGTTIAYAIAGIERRQTLQSGNRVELDVAIPQSGELLLDFGSILDEPLRIENVVNRTDGGYLAYATAADPQRVADTLASVSLVDRTTAFGTAEDGQIEFGFRDCRLLDMLSAYDARLHRLVTGERTNTLTVRLPRPDQVREFVAHLQDRYPDATLQAQRTIETTDATSLTGVLEELTDRQREIAAIAHRRGLFEWPRESSGEDIADAIGIAPATFHQHLRAVERRTFEALFGPR